MPCRDCGAANKRNVIACAACGVSLGPINVNIFADLYFKNGLEKRYNAVVAEVVSADNQAKVLEFEREIASNARAVINMDARFLFKVVNEDEAYLSYQRAVEEGKRVIMNFESDLRRCVVETSFYGFTGRNLVYAALTLDDAGVRSYGDVSVVLVTGQVELRTTVFEKNTYPLYDELTEGGWRAGTIMPAGYGGTWEDRSRMAVIKHGLEISNSKNPPKFSAVLLASNGKHRNDEFIELHIFNKVTKVNFAKVTFHKKPAGGFDDVQFQIFKQKLENQSTEITGA